VAVADSASFDFSELTALAADLGEVPDNAGPLINSAVQFTSREIKKSAAKRVGSGSKSWRLAAAAIDYDTSVLQAFGATVLKSEIGYNKSRKRAAKLGNLREFGAPDSPGGSLAPHSDLAHALHENEDDFVKGIAKAAADAERKAGL
jgi:hypothetical protein